MLFRLLVWVCAFQAIGCRAPNLKHIERPLVPPEICAKGSDSGKIARVAAGWDFTCTLTCGGSVRCWGGNDCGQLGDGTGASHLTPMEVLGLGPGVREIAAGSGYGCALNDRGGVKCWGTQGCYARKDLPDHLRPLPTDVVGLSSGVVAIRQGEDSTCVLTNVGGVKCWNNYDGEEPVRGGNEVRDGPPVDQVGLTSGVLDLALSGTLCAVTSEGKVICWGNNLARQIADDDNGIIARPVELVGLTSLAEKIAVGWGFICILNRDGNVECRGRFYNSQGSVVSGLDLLALSSFDVVAMSAGGAHACVLTSDGAIKCWGDNSEGRLGDGTTTSRTVPVDVLGLSSGVVALSTNFKSSCAVTNAGRVWCWGDNSSGQLGDGTTTDRAAPVEVRF